MMIEDNKVILAWRKAGEDLGIRVKAPFALAIESSGVCHFPVHLPDFGGTKGAVLLLANPPTFDTDAAAVACATQNGFWISILNTDQYGVYDREHFIATLNDFQFYGTPEQKPDWYTGKPWTKPTG